MCAVRTAEVGLAGSCACPLWPSRDAESGTHAPGQGVRKICVEPLSENEGTWCVDDLVTEVRWGVGQGQGWSLCGMGGFPLLGGVVLLIGVVESSEVPSRPDQVVVGA